MYFRARAGGPHTPIAWMRWPTRTMRASRCTSTCTNSPGCPTHSGAPPALARVVLALRRSFTRGLLSEGTERVVTPLSCHSLCGAIECCSRHHRIAQQPKIRVGRHSRTSHRAPIVASHRNSIALGPRLERLRHLCSVSSPAHRGEATAVRQGLRFGSSPRPPSPRLRRGLAEARSRFCERRRRKTARPRAH